MQAEAAILPPAGSRSGAGPAELAAFETAAAIAVFFFFPSQIAGSPTDTSTVLKLQIRHTTFMSYIKFANPLIVGPKNCERVGQVLAQNPNPA